MLLEPLPFVMAVLSPSVLALKRRINILMEVQSLVLIFPSQLGSVVCY